MNSKSQSSLVPHMALGVTEDLLTLCMVAVSQCLCFKPLNLEWESVVKYKYGLALFNLLKTAQVWSLLCPLYLATIE